MAAHAGGVSVRPMPTHAERTALLFLAGVLATGAGVRVARAVQAGEKPPPAAQAALAAQQRVVDSVQRLRGARPAVSAPPVRARVARTPVPLRPPVRFPIDVDRADSAQLVVLPGVGPALARRIVAQRDSFGAFGSLARFEARVRGVGPAMTRRLEPLVTFSRLPGDRSP
jgi:competence protein ComEA